MYLFTFDETITTEHILWQNNYKRLWKLGLRAFRQRWDFYTQLQEKGREKNQTWTDRYVTAPL